MKYQYTEQEKDNVIANFVKDGKVVKIPAKEKKKYILLSEFTRRFQKGKIYTEREMNDELLKVYPEGEHVEQRRYLITFELFKRSGDGSKYWLNSER